MDVKTVNKLTEPFMSESEKKKLSVVSLADRPNERSSQYGKKGLSAEELKEAFSALPTATVDKLNLLVNELNRIIAQLASEDTAIIEALGDARFDRASGVLSFLKASGDSIGQVSLGTELAVSGGRYEDGCIILELVNGENLNISLSELFDGSVGKVKLNGDTGEVELYSVSGKRIATVVLLSEITAQALPPSSGAVKKYVDTIADGKLDVVTTNSQYRRLYGIGKDGSQMAVRIGNAQSEVVARTVGGQVWLPDQSAFNLEVEYTGKLAARRDYVECLCRSMDHRVKNLEAAASGKLYETVTDESVKYKKEFTDGAPMPYGILSKIGGMSYEVWENEYSFPDAHSVSAGSASVEVVSGDDMPELSAGDELMATCDVSTEQDGIVTTFEIRYYSSDTDGIASVVFSESEVVTLPYDYTSTRYSECPQMFVSAVCSDAEVWNAEISNVVLRSGKVSRSKNLLSPSAVKSTTTNGITIVNNGDGSFTLNGTPTADTVFAITDRNTALKLHKGTYTLSGGYSSSVWLQGKLVENDDFSVYDYGNGETFTLDENASFRYNIRVSAKAGAINDLVIRPQLELGDSATEFERYYSHRLMKPAAVEEISVYGKNLFDPMHGRSTDTESKFGLTVSYLKDEDCFLINGTSTGTGSVFTTPLFIRGGKGKNYCLSSEIVGGKFDYNGSEFYIVFDSGAEKGQCTDWINGAYGLNSGRVKALDAEYITCFRFYTYSNVVFKDLKLRIMLTRSDTVDTEYVPYRDAPLEVISIPEEIKSLSGYGCGNQNKYNYLDLSEKKFYRCVDDELFELSSPEVTDVSEYLSGEYDVISLDGAGGVTFENSIGEAVPSTLSYKIKI